MAQHDNNIELRLTRLVTEQFATLSEPGTEGYEIEGSVGVGGIYTARTFGIKHKVSFSSAGVEFMKIEVSTHFEISPDCWNNLSEGGTKDVVLHKHLMKHLVCTSLDSTRGVLHAKTENTPFNRFIIPLSDGSEFSGGDIIISRG